MSLPQIDQAIYTLTLSDGTKVEYRPYKVKEEKAILIAKETGTSGDMVKTSKELVKACTFDKVDVDKLTTFDFEKLFLNIRGKSAGETSDLLITCKECGHKEEVTVNIEDARLEGDMKSEKERTIAITDEVGVVMHYPQIGAADNMEEDQSTESMMRTIISCINMIYDAQAIYKAEDSSYEELSDFVDSLSSKQFADMVEVISDMPKLVINDEFNCSKCKEHNEVKLEGIGSFF